MVCAGWSTFLLEIEKLFSCFWFVRQVYIKRSANESLVINSSPEVRV